MRVLLIARNKHFVPQEALPMLFQGFTAWREQYKGNMEGFYFFAGIAGGAAILNVPDEVALNKMVIEWPLAGFAELEILPILDGDVALRQYAETIQAMMSAQQ